jgi:hypothetical protein
MDCRAVLYVLVKRKSILSRNTVPTFCFVSDQFTEGNVQSVVVSTTEYSSLRTRYVPSQGMLLFGAKTLIIFCMYWTIFRALFFEFFTFVFVGTNRRIFFCGPSSHSYKNATEVKPYKETIAYICSVCLFSLSFLQSGNWIVETSPVCRCDTSGQTPDALYSAPHRGLPGLPRSLLVL